MAITSFKVRQDLIVSKRQRRLKQRNSNGMLWTNRYTLNSEVKAWVHEMIKHHWYLHEDRFGSLSIAFCNDEDAMKYKLAWH